jgi:hypothetical protein
VQIITESITVLKSLRNNKSVTQLVQKILKQSVIAQERGIKLTFAWICAHNRNEWRDLAESLAKAGATAHRSIDYHIIPMSFIKRIIYEKNLELWNTRWVNTKYTKRRDNKEIFSHSFRSTKSKEDFQHKLLFNAFPYKSRKL